MHALMEEIDNLEIVSAGWGDGEFDPRLGTALFPPEQTSQQNVLNDCCSLAFDVHIDWYEWQRYGRMKKPCMS